MATVKIGAHTFEFGSLKELTSICRFLDVDGDEENDAQVVNIEIDAAIVTPRAFCAIVRNAPGAEIAYGFPEDGLAQEVLVAADFLGRDDVIHNVTRALCDKGAVAMMCEGRSMDDDFAMTLVDDVEFD